MEQSVPPGTELAPGEVLEVEIHAGPISSTEENAGKSGVLDVGLAGIALTPAIEAALQDLLVRIYPTIPMELQLTPLTAAERFTALASGTVDLIVGDLRNSEAVSSGPIDPENGASIWTLDNEWGSLVQANVARYLVETGD